MNEMIKKQLNHRTIRFFGSLSNGVGHGIFGRSTQLC